MSKIPQGEWSAIAARYQDGESISNIARSYGCTPPAIHYILKRNRQVPAAADRPLMAQRQAAAAADDAAAGDTVAGGAIATSPQPPPGTLARIISAPLLVRTRAPVADRAQMPPSAAGRPGHNAQAAPTPGLDSELHHRAEAAIEVFRMSFDAALTEGSPDVRERLRQAAADLMRVAARTTIVLDRLTAGAERAVRAPNYPRSAHMHD